MIVSGNTPSLTKRLRVFSKRRIGFEGPVNWREFALISEINVLGSVQTDKEAEHTRQYVSILRGVCNTAIDLIWGPETKRAAG